MLAHMELRALPVELRLGAISRIRQAAPVLRRVANIGGSERVHICPGRQAGVVAG